MQNEVENRVLNHGIDGFKVTVKLKLFKFMVIDAVKN
jgi:hypothetical protein